jgi:hypothetical protein
LFPAVQRWRWRWRGRGRDSSDDVIGASAERGGRETLNANEHVRFAPCTPCTPCTVRFLLSALHSRLASPHPASPRLAFAWLAACCPQETISCQSNTTPPPYHRNTIAKAQRSRRCESGAWSTRQAQSIEIMHLLSSQLSKGCCATPRVPSLRRSASNTVPNAGALTCIVYAIEPGRRQL